MCLRSRSLSADFKTLDQLLIRYPAFLRYGWENVSIFKQYSCYLWMLGTRVNEERNIVQHSNWKLLFSWAWHRVDRYQHSETVHMPTVSQTCIWEVFCLNRCRNTDFFFFTDIRIFLNLSRQIPWRTIVNSPLAGPRDLRTSSYFYLFTAPSGILRRAQNTPNPINHKREHQFAVPAHSCRYWSRNKRVHIGRTNPRYHRQLVTGTMYC